MRECREYRYTIPELKKYPGYFKMVTDKVLDSLNDSLSEMAREQEVKFKPVTKRHSEYRQYIQCIKCFVIEVDEYDRQSINWELY